MSFWYGLSAASVLLVVPGMLLGRVGRLPWPTAAAVAPALTYGVVALAIMPLGALGIPWNSAAALASLVATGSIVAGLSALWTRLRGREQNPGTAIRTGPALAVTGGVLLGAAVIAWAAHRSLTDWQSIPSTWDSVWHANTIRWILDTGDASSLHMGELRNTDTHAELYYPSVFHGLAAVFAQLTGAAPATAYTLSSLAAAVWLFPTSAAVLAWTLLRARGERRPDRGANQWPAAAAAGTAAVVSTSFTALPYIEFNVHAMPNMVAYGIAVPTTVLVMSCLANRRRIPLAIIAVVGLFSLHLTGGVIMVTFLAAWWCTDTVRHPVRGRLADLGTLTAVGGPALAIMLPQFLGVFDQAEIIAGHAFASGVGKQQALFNAVFQHTRHLGDSPIQNLAIGLAALGAVVLVARRVWWSLAVWALLIVAITHAAAPFGGPIGAVIRPYADLFYSDPRRLAAVVTMLLAAWAGIGLYTLVIFAVAGSRRLIQRLSLPDPGRRFWLGTTAVLLVASSLALAGHYFPRNSLLLGRKYDSIMVNQQDLDAWAYLAQLPGARDTMIANANVDGSAWMYAVADLHPMFTHYDYPVQQGPGLNRFIIWAYADDDHNPWVPMAVANLNIRYLMVSDTVVGGFHLPDGLMSLNTSRAWERIYNNGHAQIYQWRGGASPS